MLIPATSTQSAICRAATDESGIYVQQVVLRVTGHVDHGRLAAAWQLMTVAQPALRSIAYWRDGGWVQAISASSHTTHRKHDLQGLPESQRLVVVRELIGRARAGIDLQAGPSATLDVIMLSGNLSLWAFSYHHAIIDGSSVRILLHELAERYAGSASRTELAGASTATMAEISERLRSLPEDEVRHAYLAEAASYPEVMPTWPGRSTGTAATLLTTECTIPAGAATRAARALGVSVPSLIQAAVLGILAHARGDAHAAIALTVDMRLLEPDALGLAGMFGCVLPVAASFDAADTVGGIAKRLHQSRIPLRARPRVGLPELLALLAGHTTGAPDVLLTFQPTGDLPAPPAGLVWERDETREATEFALNIDVFVGDSKILLRLQRDTTRVTAPDLARLTDSLTAFLADPARTFADVAEPGWLTRIRAQPKVSPGQEEILPVILDAITAVTNEAFSEDDDLLARGLSSLTLMLVAVELTERGLPYTVAELLECRTPRRLAGVVRAPREVARTGSGGVSPEISTFTKLEQSVLARTNAIGWGDQPVREQSRIGYLALLDRAALEAALSDLLEAYPSLRRGFGTAGTRRPIPRLVDLGETNDPAGVATSWLHRQISNPQCANGLPLFTAAAAIGREETHLALDFHTALLDGWSFGTLIRDWQRAYDARRTGRKFRPSGKDVSVYARWAAGLDRRAARAHWASALAESSFPRIAPASSHRRAATIGLALPGAREFATRSGLTEQVSAIALAAAALAAATGQAPGECTAVRTSVRPVHLPDQLRVVGHVMAEIPVPLVQAGAQPASNYARSFANFLTHAREHAHGGDLLLRDAVSIGADRSLWRNLVVFEEYLLTDEWAARTAVAPHWRETETWRRDISPSVRTLYILPRSEGYGLTLTSVADEDPEQVLADVVDEAERIWGDISAPLPLAVCNSLPL
jgi:aryl carrier-like protein